MILIVSKVSDRIGTGNSGPCDIGHILEGRFG